MTPAHAQVDNDSATTSGSNKTHMVRPIAKAKAAGAAAFAKTLASLSASDTDYWTYRRMAQRPGLHGLVRYPAMMVPRMQADVLDAACAAVPNLRIVFDPFVGSGTTLLEALRRRVAFDGIDINPLAILICRSKLLNLAPSRLSNGVEALLRRLSDDRSGAVEVDFPGRDKWFTPQSRIELSKIRRSIANEPSKQLRRFFWVVMSEAIRQTSLSRETTYKLHIRPADSSHSPSTIRRFVDLLAESRVRYEAHCGSHVQAAAETSKVRLFCRDVRDADKLTGPKAQLLLTSPPYGDNRSTIPYGQFSYLALSWIPEGDLEGDSRLSRSAYATDTASLGGSACDAFDRAQTMAAVLPSFDQFLQQLSRLGRPDLEAKASSFAADLFDAIGAALTRLEHGGIAVWTLGERTIGGLKLPLIGICREANEFFGMEHVAEIQRRIQSKRTPHRNSQGKTMATESMLVMSKS